MRQSASFIPRKITLDALSMGVKQYKWLIDGVKSTCADHSPRRAPWHCGLNRISNIDHRCVHRPAKGTPTHKSRGGPSVFGLQTSRLRKAAPPDETEAGADRGWLIGLSSPESAPVVQVLDLSIGLRTPPMGGVCCVGVA